MEEVKRTELMIKDIEREIKKLLKEVPYASHKRFLSEESFSWLKNFIVCLF